LNILDRFNFPDREETDIMFAKIKLETAQSHYQQKYPNDGQKANV
jgi:hypothetical protein